MDTKFIDEIDHVQIAPGTDDTQILDCIWKDNFKSHWHFRRDVPIWVRREFFDKTLTIHHRHVDIMALIIVRRGRGTRLVNGHSHSMARGDVFLMAQDNIHAFEEPVQLYLDVVYFHQSLWPDYEWEVLHHHTTLKSYLNPGIEPFVARGNTDYFGHLSSEPHAMVEATYDRMRYEFNTRWESLHYCVRNQFFNLLVQLNLWRRDGLFTTRPARGAGIAEVLSFCDNNFQTDIKLEQLAAMMHFSDSHFRAVFTKEVGMSPAAYLRRLRLQNAKTLLRDPQNSVVDVARLSGFDGTTQFGRAFKKTFGMAPLKYRQKPKKIA